MQPTLPSPEPESAPRAKMTIRVYTVNRAGIVSAPPRATVVVPHSQGPLPFGLEPLPCKCPLHRETGAAR